MATLTQSKDPDLRGSASTPSSVANMGAFRVLPNELTILVFAFLGTKDLLNVSIACKHWNFLSEDDSLWKPLYKEKWEPKLAGVRKAGSSAVIAAEDALSLQGWRSWKNKYTTKRNWISGHIIAKHVLQPHDALITCLKFDEDKYVTGSADKTIKLTDVNTGNVEKTLSGHTSWVTCLQFDRKVIVSGSRDNTLRIWKASTGESLHVLKGHTGWVSALQFQDNKVMSRSWDLNTKVWDMSTGQCTRNHRSNSVCTSFRFQKHLLVCGYLNHHVKIWDMRSGKCHRTLYGATGSIKCLDFDDSNLVCGSEDSTLRLWDMRSGRNHPTFNGHKGSVNALVFKDHRVISAGSDGVVKVWDFKKKAFAYDAEVSAGANEPLYALDVDERKIVAAGKDKKLHIWNFSERMAYAT